MCDPTRPYSPLYGEHYWTGGPAEKRATFVEAANLPARLAGAAAFTVAELGLGTGLNLLLTLGLHRRLAPRAPLTYVAIEKHPLTLSDLAAIHAALPREFHADAAWLQSFWPPAPGWTGHARENLTLHLFHGEAMDAFVSPPPFLADAWYLDGFSPARNPDMWTPQLLEQAAARTAPGGTVATYSAVGGMRRALESAGFEVTRRPGHPPKRHRTEGIKKAP
jgi:tRNA U34 5-methylaminomethyl-2-thiouridine-forming methyltransferase MnmC